VLGSGTSMAKLGSGGIRYQPLRELIKQMHPGTPENTISGSIWDLETEGTDPGAKAQSGIVLAH
jgi:hypothetical protein